MNRATGTRSPGVDADLFGEVAVGITIDKA